jgi:hypothetical protein
MMYLKRSAYNKQRSHFNACSFQNETKAWNCKHYWTTTIGFFCRLFRSYSVVHSHPQHPTHSHQTLPPTPPALPHGIPTWSNVYASHLFDSTCVSCESYINMVEGLEQNSSVLNQTRKIYWFTRMTAHTTTQKCHLQVANYYNLARQ